jgi:putative oxidoreductase
MDVWTAVLWVGKLVFCGFFFMSGLKHFTRLKDVVAYGRSRQLPLPELLVPLSGLMLTAGPVMILLSWHALWGFAMLVLFLIAAAFLIHKYWVETDPMQRGNQRNHFGKNLALGAACLLLAFAVHRSGVPL